MTTSMLFSKIIGLNATGRRESAPVYKAQEHEHRSEFRRESNDRMFVQVVKSVDESLVGTTIACRALDVSAKGLKIASKELIPMGCTLDLWVDDSARPGKFFLSSEVRWVSQSENDDDYHVGVELVNGTATDILVWQERQS